MNQDLISYYKERAREYDQVYSIHEKQADLLAAIQLFQVLVSNKTVLEITSTDINFIGLEHYWIVRCKLNQ